MVLDLCNKAEEIQNFITLQRRAYRVNYTLNIMIILLGLLLSAGVTISGILNQGQISAVLGVFIALLFGLNSSLAIGERADFNRVMFAEADNLVSRLRFQVGGAREFQSALSRFLVLRRHAATSVPRGQGLETVRRMYQEMTSEARDVSSGS